MRKTAVLPKACAMVDAGLRYNDVYRTVGSQRFAWRGHRCALRWWTEIGVQFERATIAVGAA